MVLPLFLQIVFCRIHGKNRKYLESSIYKNIYAELSNKETQKKLRISKPEIHRRNTGYAVDILLNSEFFDGTNHDKPRETALWVGQGHLQEVTLKVDLLPPQICPWWW
jgi:hypothetical protein